MQPNKKVTRGWVLFDWANSAYSLVIVSTIFPKIFLFELKDTHQFMGINFGNPSAIYTAAICFSYFIILLITPILGGIADYGGYKKRYMQFFTYLGVFACVLLYFFDSQHIYFGVWGAVLGSIGFSGSMVFYNAYLPEIASKKNQDKISARGYAMGYLGSSLLLILLFILSTNPALLFVTTEVEVFKIGFVMVGLWWLGWSAYTFKVLPQNKPVHKSSLLKYCKKGIEELSTAVRDTFKNKPIKYFLIAFLCLSLGFQTLWIISPLFAASVIKLEGAELIVIVLIMQFVGIIGSILFAKLSKQKGNIFSLSITVLLFVIVCLGASLTSTKSVFYIIAILMGFAMGGMQSISRSTFSKLISNQAHHASFFSLYDVIEKASILIGTALVTLVYAFDISMFQIPAEKFVLLLLGVFFIIGLFLLLGLVRKHFKLAQTK